MKPDFAKNNGLVPVIIQDFVTLQVLMLGYMNEEALQITQETKKVTFFSRTKKRLWTKGEESVASSEIGRAISLAMPSALNCPIRLGTSSPRMMEK